MTRQRPISSTTDGNEASLLAPEDIRTLFEEELSRSETGEMSYAELWSTLRKRRLHIRGGDRKGELKNIYGAIAKDRRFEKVRPGVFKLTRSGTRKGA